MLFEYVLLTIAGGTTVWFVILPGMKLYRKLFPKKMDALEAARERLAQAQRDREAARLNAKAEEVYDEILNEALKDYDDAETKHQKKGRG